MMGWGITIHEELPMNLNRKYTYLIALGVLPLALLFINISQADSTPSRVFDVKQCGAKGDGKTLDTDAIQKALDECGKAGGGVVQLTRGTYLSKPISLRSKTTLQLDEGAKLQATGEQAAFLKSGTNWLAATSGSDFIPFIRGSKLTDVTITGKGIIDGRSEEHTS